MCMIAKFTAQALYTPEGRMALRTKMQETVISLLTEEGIEVEEWDGEGVFLSRRQAIVITEFSDMDDEDKLERMNLITARFAVWAAIWAAEKRRCRVFFRNVDDTDELSVGWEMRISTD